jgi:DNA helicase HerA-like ATPase
LFSQITLKTHHNIGVDLSRLTKDEIVEFTNLYLSITEMKDKYIIIDEMADYTPQIGESSKELERLDEIVTFTNLYLSITEMKDKYIIIDEMADYTPQIGESSKELERLVRHGRNFGNTFIFNTQRPAYLTKNILNLIDVVVFFRLVWKRDIDVVKDILNNLGQRNITTEVNEITNMGVGECKVYKFGVDGIPDATKRLREHDEKNI